MHMSVFMQNTNSDELEPTLEFLRSCEARNLRHYLSSEGVDTYQFILFVDTDEDVVNLVRVATFYNDRDPEQIRVISSALGDLLAENKS